MMHTVDNMADKFINDVKDVVTELMKNPEKPVEGKVNQSLCPAISVQCVMNALSLDGVIRSRANIIRPVVGGGYNSMLLGFGVLYSSCY